MNYGQYFALEKKLKASGFDGDRTALVSQFTDGKKTSLRALTDRQYKAFILWLNNYANAPTVGKNKNERGSWQDTAENRMRRKIYSLFVTKMGYEKEQFYAWVVKYGKFHKALQEHNNNELTALTTQAEQVYKSWVEEINKQ